MSHSHSYIHSFWKGWWIPAARSCDPLSVAVGVCLCFIATQSGRRCWRSLCNPYSVIDGRRWVDPLASSPLSGSAPGHVLTIKWWESLVGWNPTAPSSTLLTVILFFPLSSTTASWYYHPNKLFVLKSLSQDVFGKTLKKIALMYKLVFILPFLLMTSHNVRLCVQYWAERVSVFSSYSFPPTSITTTTVTTTTGPSRVSGSQEMLNKHLLNEMKYHVSVKEHWGTSLELPHQS